MKLQTVVWVRTRFVGFHRWKDAPEHVAFLREFHRHEFHVRVAVPVTHLNREVEFFTLKAEVDEFIKATYADKQFELSCEQIAENLLAKFRAFFVEVSEDGENGATIYDEHAFPTTTFKSWIPSDMPESVIEPQPPPSAEELAKIKEEMENYATGLKRVVQLSGMDVRKLREDYSLITRGKCFLGVEAEGPLVGVKTLFVPYGFDWRKFDDVVKIAGYMNFDQVYLGAGNKPVCGEGCGTWLREYLHRFGGQTTIELGKDMSVAEAYETIKPYQVKNRALLVVQQIHPSQKGLSSEHWNTVIGWLKWIENGTIYWRRNRRTDLPHPVIIETSVSDPLFAQDEEINL